MDALKGLLENPLFWKIILGYWLFSAAAAALPKPDDNKFYQFVYAFAHGFAGNLDRAASSFKLPGAA